VTWIEHYPGEEGKPDDDILREHFDLVQFNVKMRNGHAQFSNPRWQRLSRDAVRKMTGEKL
jgi:hypothetical protein